MHIIPTRIHGLLDYAVALLLIFSPRLFGFNFGGAETWVPIALGVATILYSLLTNYELGVFRLWSMKTHLTLDFLNGALLLASPWLFGFYDRVQMPHFVLGLCEILVVAASQSVPGSGRLDPGHPAAGRPGHA